jgi:hypothetical protein
MNRRFPLARARTFTAAIGLGLSAGLLLLAATPAPAAAPAAHMLNQVPMNILLRIRVARPAPPEGPGGTDLVTIRAEELAPGDQLDGAIYYVPHSAIAGRTGPLNRLRDPTIPDRMDSVLAAEGAHTFAATLGYPWNNAAALPGLTQLVQWYDGDSRDPNYRDHATGQATEPTPGGYTTTAGFARWGLPRYFDGPGLATPLSHPGPDRVDVILSRAAGGAVWEWWWYPASGATPVQYINHYGYGRLVQTDLFFNREHPCPVGPGTPTPTATPTPTPSARATPTPVIPPSCQNPAEAGSYFGVPYSREYQASVTPAPGIPTATQIPFVLRQGAPLIAFTPDGAHYRVHTAALPVEWDPRAYGGGPANPVVYPDLAIGKAMQLNYNNWPRVTQYIAQVENRGDLVPLPNDVFVLGPYVALRANFNRFYSYAPAIDATPVYRPLPNHCGSGGFLQIQPDTVELAGVENGGVIVTDGAAPDAAAFGVYLGQDAVATGRFPYTISWLDFSGCGTWPPGAGADDFPSSAVTPRFGLLSLNAHSRLSFTSYMIVGTRAQVQGSMLRLCVWQGACRVRH